jgi:hypothetical protein
MQTAGSGPDSPSTAIFATLPVTAIGHPGNLGLFEIPIFCLGAKETANPF